MDLTAWLRPRLPRYAPHQGSLRLVSRDPARLTSNGARVSFSTNMKSAWRVGIAAVALLTGLATPATAVSGDTGTIKDRSLVEIAGMSRGLGEVRLLGNLAGAVELPGAPRLMVSYVLEDAGGRFYAFADATPGTVQGFTVVDPRTRTAEAYDIAPDGTSATRVAGLTSSKSMNLAGPSPTIACHLIDFFGGRPLYSLTCGFLDGIGPDDVVCGVVGLGGKLAAFVCDILFSLSSELIPINPYNVNWDGQTEAAISIYPDYPREPDGYYSIVANFFVRPVGCRPTDTANRCTDPTGASQTNNIRIAIDWPVNPDTAYAYRCVCSYTYHQRNWAGYTQAGSQEPMRVSAYQGFGPIMGESLIGRAIRVYTF